MLNFLRTSKLTLPENFQENELLAVEVDFYQIPELNAALESKIGDRGKKRRGDIVVEKRRLWLNDSKVWDWTIYGNRQAILNLHNALVAGQPSQDDIYNECYGRYQYTEGEGVESGKLSIKQFCVGSSHRSSPDRGYFGLYRVLNIKLWMLGYRLHDIKPTCTQNYIGDADLIAVDELIHVEGGETFYFEPSSMDVYLQI